MAVTVNPSDCIDFLTAVVSRELGIYHTIEMNCSPGAQVSPRLFRVFVLILDCESSMRDILWTVRTVRLAGSRLDVTARRGRWVSLAGLCHVNFLYCVEVA